jgi:hypothetical protein
MYCYIKLGTRIKKIIHYQLSPLLINFVSLLLHFPLLSRTFRNYLLNLTILAVSKEIHKFVNE